MAQPTEHTDPVSLPAEDVYPLTPLQAGMLFPDAADAPEPDDGVLEVPLSFAQQRLWLVDRLEPGTAAYNMPYALRLRGALDADALQASLDAMVRRHETLRTTFADGDDGPVQLIHPDAEVRLAVLDLRHLPEAEREAAAERLAGEEALRPFDLARGPLLRGTLLRLGAEYHVLLFTLHHIVSDGWSMEVLVREVSALYAALSRGEEPRLPELEVQYADFAVWQREQLREEVLEQELAWWRGQLSGAPPLLELPTDRPRAAGQSPRAARHSLGLAPETARGVRALSRQQGTTLFMTLLAGWQALLGRYAGQDDVVVGTPVAGRTQRELEALIGFFVNMLCMRADLGGDPTGAELLARVRERALGAYAHQDLPFERLVEELAPERSLTHAPIFQAAFSVNRSTPERRLRLGDVAMDSFGDGDAVAKFDLYMAVNDRDEELDCVLAYREALFDADTVARMAGHLETLLAGLAAGPRRRLSELSLLRADERAQLLAESRADAVAHPGACLHELFAAQAAATPHLPAVADLRRTVTYAELEREASRLANHLRRRGVGPETRVGVCLGPGVELVAAVLGVFKAGGAYVPLDPAYPAERLAYTLADSGATALLTRSSLLDALPAFAGTTVRLDADGEAIAGEPDGAPASGAGPRNAAYVIYTSGSTGRPKGVVVEHAAVANTLLGTRAAFAPAPGETMPALASSAFDIWLFEVFTPLLSGGRALLPERDAVRDVERLVAELADVDAVHAVPALMREIVQRVQAGPGTLAGVKRVFVGGDAVPPDLIGQLRRAFPSADAWVLYGPTEAAILGAAARLRPEGGYAWQVLGRALPGAALYVCDAWGGPLPAGVAGELWIGGAGVARGYLGRPELTAERFVPDPFGGEPGARLYRTGDRVRRRADGELEFLGRTDAQVKIRGFRIEPGEVEAALLSHPAVREAAVAVREDAPGRKRLVAYVAPEEESGVELWPSIGEYFVYDELIYRGLTRDDRRNARYLRALEAAAPGKVVLDVGTGMDAVLARLAVQAGARHVYAVEILETSYLAARERIRELGLEDRVTLVHGDALTVELPEPADVVVSEIVEAIAGGEGAATILNGVRRLLAPGAVTIPGLTRTCMAAVTLPEEIRRAPAFSPTAAHYVERIWEQVGHPFDLRLCIKNFPADNRLSDAGVFEELDFGAGEVAAEYRRAEELEIRRAGRLDGLLLWLRMELAEGGTLDIMEEETAWFPVYFPLFDPGVEVRPGDRLRVECRAELPDGGVAPDYAARGTLLRGDGTEVPFEFVSPHHAPRHLASPFYRRLFAGGGVPVREGRGELAPSLREHLAARLPEHMVPSAFVVLDRLPLGASGKLDRRALPAPEREAAAYVAPRTATEETLAGIWAQVLGRERVGVEDGFIELGGHSLLATQVVSRARQAFGVEVPLRALFEAGSVARLAERIDALRVDAEAVAPPIGRTPRDAPPPLSFAQQRLWLVDRLEPGSAAYNMPFALRLRGALDAAALRMALDELVRRHEALRTTFAERDGAAVQLIHPPAPVALAERDLRGLPAAERGAEAERLAGEEALLPFDLERGPLLRSTLLRLDDADHVLCFTLHHVVGDGWSVQVMVREVSTLYTALLRREAPGLADLPIQYADFAVWQRGWLRGDVLEAQLAWWRERLAGAPPLLEVPTDHPRVPGQSPLAASHALVLPADVSRGLRELSERGGATLFMTVLAAWQALLGRYAGQDDVVVGSPVAGRNRRETEGLIGFFVNMLALRADLSGDPAWTELLGRVRDGALGAFDHQDLPFERLVEDLGVERSLTHSPVFQATFALHRASGLDERLRLGDVALEPFGGGERVAKFDLELVFTEAGESLAGTLVYRAALWEPATVARLAGHLETLLEAMAADPRRRLSETPLLRGAERAQVLESWNATAHPYPRDVCVHDLFAVQAARTPDAVALVHGDQRVTYAELDRRSALLADDLRRRGVGPEVRAGVCMGRTPELVVSLLAVLRAGGAYVPMDPGYPVERLRYMLADSGAALLLADSAAAERLGDCGVEVMLVDGGSARIAADEEPPLSHSRTFALSHSSSLAYVVYTSGSTGTPKGVLGTHRATVNRFAWMWSEYPFAADEVCCQKTPLAFVDSVWEVFGPLLAGVPSVLVPDEDARDPRALAGLLSRHGVTRIVLVPSLLRALLDGDAGLGESCPRLRLVVTSGEALPAGLARRFADAVPGATLLNLYGSSEVAADSTHHALRPAGIAAGERVPIGRPVWNTRVYVADAALEPVPTGAAGELYVAGDGLARGYMGNPAATAERFVPDPFAAEPGARMYRTGDRARWTAAGELEYLGRADAQVKVRGFRIELGEIEAALRAHPAVREAVAVVREDAAGDRRIAAYVVAAEGQSPSTAELRAHLGARLPEYMVPPAFVALDALPLTPNGKLDRRALPAPRWGAEGAYVAPGTATEEVLAEVWAAVLGVERVGVEENFFALGGHSLLATQVASRVRQALGVELPLRALFEAPTVAGLALRVDALRSAGAPAAPPMGRAPRDEPLPLSFAQQRLWVVDRIEPGSAAYNMAFALRLRGALDVGALRGGLDALVRRHEALRTVFAAHDGRPVQVIHPPAPVPLPVFDLRPLPEAAREREAERLVAEEALRPFDLERGPLLRSTLLRLDAADHVLCFTLHHVVSDGWSMQVLVREVSTLYPALLRSEEPRLPELPVQYADYAVWQREWLRGDALDAQIGFWRERLAGAPPLLEIPTDHPRARGLSPQAASHALALPADVSRGLRELSRREGTTLFMTVLAGWQALLAKYAGQDDVVVGTAVAGRTRGETEGLIGFFVNMLALRADLSGEPAWAELLGRVREAALGAYDHQDLPFERLVEALGVERSLTHSPVFQATFALRRAGGDDGRLCLGDVALEPFGAGDRVARFDLELALADSGDALGGALVYRAALWEAATMERLAGHLEAVLAAMAADPRRRLSELSLLRGTERAQVLEAWSTGGDACAGDELVHERFARQALRTPDAVAVRAGARTLTCGELDRDSASLARHLGTLGVGPDVRVGICLERGPEMVVAVLGVLRAGGAYVPLDPSHPAERLARMLEDAAPAVLVTSGTLLERLPEHGARVVLLDRDTDALSHSRTFALSHSPSPDNLAYVIFTSGSTGRPKGVAVTHRGLAAYLAWAADAYAAPGHGAPVHSSLSFDLTVTSLLVPLLRGERVVLVDEGEGVEGLARALREEPGFTLVKLTPAHLALLAQQLTPAEAAAAARTLIVGGEALPAELAAHWRRVAPETEIVNEYGPTETVVGCVVHRVRGGSGGGAGVPIGRPIAGARVYVLDAAGEPVPPGVPGELCVGGAGVARGYLAQPEQTAGRFVPDPFGREPGARLYRTGDRARWLPTGELDYLGRLDAQVKVRGYRVEPGEVESVLASLPEVREAVVVAREDAPGDRRLVAYVVPEAGAGAGDVQAELRSHLRERLPEYMVPAAFVVLDSLPLTPSGKADRRALPAPSWGGGTRRQDATLTETERAVAAIWEEVLGVPRVGVADNFFDLGGHSLLLVQVHARLQALFPDGVALIDLFEHHTLGALAARLDRGAGPSAPAEPGRARVRAGAPAKGRSGREVAVVGMAGRFPGARDLDEFWSNLRAGVRSIRRFTDEELRAAGVPRREREAPGYVPAAGVLDGAEMFDAAFFGITPREATVMNPQQRVFLECAWEALERAGYAAGSCPGRVGVWAAEGQNRYLVDVLSRPELVRAVGSTQVMLSNSASAATLASYKLDLEGPSMNVQTACSSSLVAVHLACKSLLDGESDVALAGGVRIELPQTRGYHHQVGGIMSPTGECSPFDAGARGTVAGSGAGVVVLRRLDDALADGDTVLAVIRGTAVNNDGGRKVGFTTPRREGQAAAITDALAAAGVQPAEISYVEAHGSGTEVGDPIEVAALSAAFGEGSPGSCALGAVKSSIGHLDAAAGVVGLIKTVLALQHGEIPPAPYFSKPNPKIDFARSPFYVTPELRPWTRSGAPRRAGVSSFGLGGTNAHLVLEEAPEPAPSGPSRPWQLLVLSGRTPSALEAATDRLAEHLRAHPDEPLADVAHTLRAGRRRFERRRVLVCRGREDAVAALESRDARRLLEAAQERDERPVAFLFPGVGDHYAGMARGLYDGEPVFRAEVDRCAALLREHTGADVREVLFPGEHAAAEDEGGAARIDLRGMLGRGAPAGDDPLGRTELAQPAVFVVEYALARLWMSWGVRPDAMIGHSLGEYAAATVAGVFALEDALALLAERARLIAALPAGAMLAVPMDPAALRPRLRGALALAAHNAPGLCTVSGPADAVAALEAELVASGVACRRLNAGHAFHSAEMEPVAAELAERLRGVRLSAPATPFVSGVTGTWIRAEEATDPAYWARHLCGTVRFADGMAALLDDPRRVLLEVGPGRTLGTFAVHAGAAEGATFASLRHAYTRQADQAFLLETLGRLWMAGVRVDWDGFVAGERRRRVPLPTYPFERQPYLVEPRRRRRRPRGEADHRPVRPVREDGSPDAPVEDAAGVLPALQPRPATGTRYVAPSGELEERIAALWQDLLGFERIGAHDDFFSLGGHSLTATHLVARIQAELQADVSLHAVFEAPTIAGLAARVAELRAGDASRVEPIRRVPRTGPLPLSFAQQRLWVVDRLDPGNPAYNMPYVLRLRGVPDVRVLRGSLDALVARHETLRTTFVEQGGEPMQTVHAPSPVALPLVDLGSLPDPAREARRLVAEEALRPFDLVRGPLLRTTLLRLAADDHVLCYTMHHVVSDGWSKGVIVKEISNIYSALARGEAPELPELPVQYADFAVWQREWLSGPNLEAQLSYWRERLAGAPPLLEIPTDHPRAIGQSVRARMHRLSIPEATSHGLQALSRREGTTLFMTLLAAWQVLLGRWSGQEDLVVGGPISGRTRWETEGLIGFFVNMLPHRADLRGDPTWSELLARVREAARGAYAHQELPFERLVEDLVTERSLTHNPLFQVAFTLERSDGRSVLALGGLGVESFGGEESASKFDLDVAFVELGERVAGALTYRTGLFEAATVARMAAHLEALLEAMTADPRARLSEVSLLRGAERARVLEEWNDTAAALPGEPVHERFAAQAARTPGAPAVHAGSESLSYGELERRANRLARHLRGLGVGPEVRVGLLAERGIGWVAAVLAIFKAGGVYVPLEPSYPADRLAFMLSDSGAAVLLAPPPLQDAVPGFAGARAGLDAGREGDDAPLDSGVWPDNAAWVIYTSGSTGRPKGVVATHAGAANLLAHGTGTMGAGPGSRMLQTASATFDASLLEIFSALFSGAALHVADRETVLSPERLAALLREREIGAWVCTPALLDTLPDADFPALRTLGVGGDRCSAGTASRWSRGRRMLNMYGPTEVTIYTTEHAISPGAAGPPPIGRPVANARAYVLDASGAPTPPGVPGELHIGGAGVARGYLGLPALTAERFVPDPFGPAGARLYRTGDRVRWRADGELEFLGRTDAQVKIRGFRIEPGEIEAVLREQPGVREAVVVVREDAPGRQRLVAYFVGADGESPAAAELRARLGARLPEYMVPAAFVALERIPLSSSGKLDRAALPAPRWSSEGAYVAPRTPTERLLCGILAEVLEVERVGVEDGFFELGGHSLMATQVVSRLREAAGVEVPLRALFETPTVAALAARVDELQGAGAAFARPIERVARTTARPRR